MSFKSIIVVTLVAAALAGCSSFKNPFSGSDNTVLPGDRENVLPPDQQTARDPIVTGEQQPDLPAEPSQDASSEAMTTPGTETVTGNCKLNDPNCDPGVDQEAGSAGIE
jgi:hypothetical protein